MASAETVLPGIKGGEFLICDRKPQEVFTPEDLTEEHRAIGKAAEEFYLGEIEPRLEAIQRQEPGVAVAILRKSAASGLTAISIPERYGGLELDLPSSLIAAEKLGRDGSYAAWHGAHTGIGTLPVLYFGTEEQKQRYLPKLARAELIAAYALTEPQAGSDALAARTRADLSADGKHYLLNGQKMWITNGGAADLFTVFAKVSGRDFTAFLVERGFGGVRSGGEEKKMGIKGSSTTAVYFENTPVALENVLGEIGRGHVIAFNILNIGRLNLGALAVGGAKNVLAISLKYAKERIAFGSPISEFGAIQHKLAEMAIRIYAAESMAWRTVGLIQAKLGEMDGETRSSEAMLKALEEYAIECSLVKVFGSEVLDYVADEGVQIHGGYGFHQDYAVEKAYRDSRINRIFEGTNEVNRLLITGMLTKRAVRGKLPLQQATQALMKKMATGNVDFSDADEEIRLVHNAKNVVLLALGLASQKYGTDLEQQQEVMMNIADLIMEAFAMESGLLRSRKKELALAEDMCRVLLRESMDRIEVTARSILGACSPQEMLKNHMSVLRRLTVYDPVNAIELRRGIARRLLERERYFA